MVVRSSSSWSNEQWLSGLRSAGSHGAEAHEALLGLLCQGLRRALRDRPEAISWVEDFAQDAAVRILIDLHQFRGESQFATWALAIAMRVAFDELRRKRWKDVSLDALLDSGDAHHPSMWQRQDASFDQQRIFKALRHAIETQLTVRQRTALIAEFKEMPQTEIARHLGVTRNALYKLTHDARKNLKRCLSESGITMETVRWALSNQGDFDEA
ncbi:RNA polymerase sigma factor [Terriglobus sp. TAA 43]|uniref:RNA polymerase sigma factor n=1 Tax=Terriglobus sp. TAA 43 TaxID=278961 RepID=UPI000691D75F|nr:sigma-70 family RNA polymerase sigma factor [Terriglobus sp. TAA 43]